MAARKGHPKTGGRLKGTPNKMTAEVKAMAREYGREAIEKLAWLMQHAESEAAKVAAIKELLDRGYGRSAQPIAGDGGEGPVTIVFETGVPRE